MLAPVLPITGVVRSRGVGIGLSVRGVPGMVLRSRIVLERTQKLPITIGRFSIGFALVPLRMVNVNHHLSANLFLTEKLADFQTFVVVVR